MEGGFFTHFFNYLIAGILMALIASLVAAFIDRLDSDINFINTANAYLEDPGFTTTWGAMGVLAAALPTLPYLIVSGIVLFGIVTIGILPSGATIQKRLDNNSETE